MRTLLVVSLILLSAACARVTDNTPGQIYQVSSSEVKMLGPKKHARPAEPTKRMMEQAREACSTATFHSARPSMGVVDQWEYLFKC